MSLPEYFVQTEYNTGPEERKKVKAVLGVSYALKVLALAFAVLSAVFGPWYLAGFAGLYCAGIICRQSVFQRTEAYEYFLVRDRLKISRRNNFGRQTLLLDIALPSVTGFTEEIPVKGDRTVLDASVPGKNVMKITFMENGSAGTAYFSPSAYLTDLIKRRLR